MFMKAVILTLFLLAAIGFAMGQPSNPAGGQDPDVPISGIEILLAAGWLLGLRKIIIAARVKK